MKRRKQKFRKSIALLVLLGGIFAGVAVNPSAFRKLGLEGWEEELLWRAETETEEDREKLNDSSVSGLEVHFIDVGQGDATLVKNGNAAMLIDTGEDTAGTQLADYLQNQGVDRLDYLVLTHPDSDHIGGAPDIIERIQIDRVFMSDFEKDNETYRKLMQALDDKELSWSVPETGSDWSLGTARITIVGPWESYSDPNNSSIALLLQNGSNTFLFTGDVEEEAERDILESKISVKADVYKAGHHGSKTSSCQEFVDAVDPRTAVISCGEGNSYGHPDAQTLNTFRMRGTQVFRTDEQGTIVAVSDGENIIWNCAPSETWKAGEPTG